MTIVYVGWIRAHPGAWRYLQSIGVQGEMIYNENHRCYEYCEISFDVAIRLAKEWKEFIPGSFTVMQDIVKGVRIGPLSRPYQVLWGKSRIDLLRCSRCGRIDD
jgi:hypothetical protein